MSDYVLKECGVCGISVRASKEESHAILVHALECIYFGDANVNNADRVAIMRDEALAALRQYFAYLGESNPYGAKFANLRSDQEPAVRSSQGISTEEAIVLKEALIASSELVHSGD